MTAETLVRPGRKSQYAPEEIDAALLVLVRVGGNKVRASEITGIPATTLYTWKTSTHSERYLELAAREGPKLEELAVTHARETILRAGEIEHDVLDALKQAVQAGEAKPKDLADMASVLQRVTTSKGINGTKLLELTGRPTQVTEVRDGSAILRQLQHRLPGLIYNGEATDISNNQQAISSGMDSANARSK
jgi:hypothetical protein